MKDRLLVIFYVMMVALTSGIDAGPFYECGPGSEERYQVNLCVDRCPEVGSQRGCTGNRTCCLVGCARICFHERRTTISAQLETLPVTSPATIPALQHYIRRSNEIQPGGEQMAAQFNNTETTLLLANTTIAPSSPYSMQNEHKIDNESGEHSTIITPSSPSTQNDEISTLAVTESAVTPESNNGAMPTQVLGKLRFSSLDKTISKEEDKILHAAVKAPQQWNGISDNVVNAFDEAQQAIASTKGSDSALMWQIFEFLRIIQSKLDVFNSNNINAGNAALAGAEVMASASRSKPPLSPTDPNILIRKSLSDFSKTLGKVQSELAALSTGQQQVVRILERVFVNQLRLANGAAAFVAATASTINTRRQQRWQQERPPANPINQLMPLAEAILLDNAAILTNSAPDTSCYRLNGCSFDPCRLTKCTKFPTATCRINSCRNCVPEFFVGNSKVQCN